MAGFTRTELKVTLIIGFMIFFVIGASLTRREPRARRDVCMNNLNSISLAFRMYAGDNNNRFPTAGMTRRADLVRITELLPMLGKLLESPKWLTCPGDSDRRPVESFNLLVTENISYFVSLNATPETPDAFLAGDRRMELNGRQPSRVVAVTGSTKAEWAKSIHHGKGNIVSSGGSPSQSDTARLQQLIAEQNMPTNFLVFP